MTSGHSLPQDAQSTMNASDMYATHTMASLGKGRGQGQPVESVSKGLQGGANRQACRPPRAVLLQAQHLCLVGMAQVLVLSMRLLQHVLQSIMRTFTLGS